MAIYALRRLIEGIPVMILASIFVFGLLHMVPGDPAANLAGPDASDQDVEVIRERLGLDKPVVQQYLTWIGHAVTGDLGTSFRNGREVSSLVRSALWPTLELTIVAFALEFTLGVVLGVMAGTRLRSAWDWGLSAFTIVGIAVPHFVMGLALLYVVSFKLDWLPIGGRVAFTDDPVEALRYIALPALVLGLTGAAVLARFVRTSVSQVMNQDYIRTGRAKGLRERSVVTRHALRNGLVPVVTVMALQFAGLLTGSVVVESVFSRPGIGRLVVGAIQARDYPVVQGALLLLVVVFITINLLADLMYGLLDPRIRVA
ncbi:MAG: ABC transporter permease [Dehalococcoidia bacterium]|jgi:peptide/nickel transport system permease protein